MSGNWQDMLDKKATPAPQDAREDPDVERATDLAPPPDPKEYRPWLLQRGGRPAMFLDLRRFEPKTGMLIGCQMSYPHLISIDYIGDRMLSLDFGVRHLVIEGEGLSELTPRLQQGIVIVIQEHSSLIWPRVLRGPVVNRIVHTPSNPNESRHSS